MNPKTPALFFLDKLATKDWLKANTTFKTPFTAAGPFHNTKLVKMVREIPNGGWVLKPLKGRVSTGIVLFEKYDDRYKLLHDFKFSSLEEFMPRLVATLQKRLVTPRSQDKNCLWFIEEWIRPHERLGLFTAVSTCPPILRFSGCPEIHFVAVCPMLETATGLAGADWQDRKYAWLDLEGFVRRADDLPLMGVDAHSVGVVEKKTWLEAPIGHQIDGVSALIERINLEVASKIELWKEHSWSFDGTFDVNNEFVCIEINYRPGLNFKGFKWKAD